jgi:hypothetical protein
MYTGQFGDRKYIEIRKTKISRSSSTKIFPSELTLKCPQFEVSTVGERERRTRTINKRYKCLNNWIVVGQGKKKKQKKREKIII